MEDEVNPCRVFVVDAALPAVAEHKCVAVGHWSCDGTPLRIVAAIEH